MRPGMRLPARVMTNFGSVDRRCRTAGIREEHDGCRSRASAELRRARSGSGLAAEQLALGHDVIVDAVNGPEPARAQWRDLAGQMDAELKFIVVECGDDRIFQDRVERRSRKIEGFPEPTWEGVLRRRAEFPPWTDERLTIDSVNSRAANLQAALDYLSAGQRRTEL